MQKHNESVSKNAQRQQTRRFVLGAHTHTKSCWLDRSLCAHNIPCMITHGKIHSFQCVNILHHLSPLNSHLSLLDLYSTVYHLK